MKPEELQSWLINTALSDELNVVTRALVLSDLDNVTPDVSLKKEVLSVDWKRLLLAGSILAQSNQRPFVEAALRIATAAVTLQSDAAIRDGGAILLQKLSNYRSVDLADDRHLVGPSIDERLGVSSRIEALNRSLDNSVLIEHSGQWLKVNPFQQNFWIEANRNSWISASAPTASGKTFLVLQWLLDQVTSFDVRVAVYLAPTRALVSEIEDNLNTLIKNEKLSGISVTSLPLAEKYTDALAEKDRVVYVLTQERLHLLANALNDHFSVDLVVADEAHKVGDRLRGVVLQDALERTFRNNPHSRFIFVSPATQNPETLLEDAPVDLSKSSVDSDAPTVLQNVILASQRPLKTQLWDLKLRQTNNSELELGTLALPARPTTLKKKLALIAAAAGARGGTLVYTNGAAEAEEVALLISQALERPESKVDAELAALSDLAKRGVHEKYLLASLAKLGVAFHYGNMPDLHP